MTRPHSIWIATTAFALAAFARPHTQAGGPANHATPVSLQVSVENADGTPVGRLTQEDVVLIVDGQPRAITSFEPTQKATSVVLLLDVSASMRMGGLNSNVVLQRAIEQWLPFSLKPGDRARVGTIDRRLFLSDKFTSSVRDLTAAGFVVRNASPDDRSGPSPIWDAIDRAVDALEWEDNVRAVLVLTDGRATGNRKSLQEVGIHAAASAVSIHAIGERDVPISVTQISGDEAHVIPSMGLRSLADMTGGTYASDKQFPWSDPGPLFARILDRLHHSYTLVFTPVAADGKVHTVDVKAHSANFTTRVRKQFVASYEPDVSR